MKLNIQKATLETVEVQGQTVTRAFAEGVMLSGLIAGCGRDFSKQCAIIEQYIEAGLTTQAFPAVTQSVYRDRAERAAREALRALEAKQHVERFASYAPQSDLQVARRRAEREAKEAKMREHGARIRAANGRTSWES